MEDVVFWHFDPCGMYIVKSGYNLVVKIRDPSGASIFVGLSKR